jgi:ParB/RepB/Spo0J family partition protein
VKKKAKLGDIGARSVEMVYYQFIDRESRYRKDMGDLDALAASIRDVGLLQPVVVRKIGRDRYQLLFGARRMAALALLDWACLSDGMVPVLVIDGLDDRAQLLRAERDENTCRKDFTPSEAAALGLELEALEAPAAAERQKAAAAHGKEGGRGRKKNPSGNLPEGNTAPSAGDTRDKVAASVGLSGKTYEKAKAVLRAAAEDPEKFGPVREEMDRTGKVDPAYRKVRGAPPAPARANEAAELRVALEALRRSNSGLHDQLMKAQKDRHQARLEAIQARGQSGLKAPLIARWFRGLSKRYHPDRGGSDVEMKVVNEAYRALLELLDPSAKDSLDAILDGLFERMF